MSSSRKCKRKRNPIRFDPFQIFEVQHRPCWKLNVTVVRGINITKGSWGDYVDTPDPYVILDMPSSAERRHQTRIFDNETNPVWKETFSFHFDADRETSVELYVHLMDSNYTLDQSLGKQTISFRDFVLGHTKKMVLQFYKTSQVEIELQLLIDKPDLRFSLALSTEEKEFLEQRRKCVYKAMVTLLGNRAPRNEEEVPTIGVLGSGGGFRAMVALAGVFKALADSQILDCVTYTAGLSGSAWYISTLYSHPNWPHKSPGDINCEVKHSIDTSWAGKLLTPQNMLSYVNTVMEKKRKGQPISFTDFFGHLIGDTLLKDRNQCRLTDQRQKIKNGVAPFPMYCCLHVKKSVDARVFHEWIEFSPFEVGMPKYGTFLDARYFGSKFFMGSLVKQHEEPPLHFLQGVWGSAFCILFKRLLHNSKDTRKKDPVELMRNEMEKHISSEEFKSENESSDTEDDNDSDKETRRKADKTHGQKSSISQKQRKSFWASMLEAAFTSANFPVLSSRSGRAGMIHNFMRGLSLNQVYPFSPFSAYTTNDIDSPDIFSKIHEPVPTDIKRLYLVDSGLSFNSPYPLLLRPQRGVDVFLSFDFSARPSDSTPPFKELKLAEMWAQRNSIPFPPIDTSVFDREGMNEVYVFRDESNPKVPTVLHFPLVNIEFRRYIKPGFPRNTREEKDFADFDLFDDPETPFSTYTFTYSHEAFDRLSKLTEFNTLYCVELIKDIMAEAVERRRRYPPKQPLLLRSLTSIKCKSKTREKDLASYIISLQNEETDAESSHTEHFRKTVDSVLANAKRTSCALSDKVSMLTRIMRQTHKLRDECKDVWYDAQETTPTP